ncbi:hypothetical protein MNV49_001761 [Pseudohyphozyma bogoriensis]|nr:hypothetical protein MNV49_001761 [Pseudohyphozyma bogoriensis]
MSLDAVNTALVLSIIEPERGSSGAAGKRAATPLRVKAAPTYPSPIEMRLLGMADAEQLVFLAIVAVSAKFFRHDLHAPLLAYAQQLVNRGMADAVSTIGMLQALLTLVYWKMPDDTSAWLRVGWAIRLGYQLKMNEVRTTPLPPNEREARIVTDRERTWAVLSCFDGAYQPHNAAGAPGRMVRPKFDLYKWMQETEKLDCPQDWQLVACLELSRIVDLCPSLEEANPSNDNLAGQMMNMLATLFDRHLSPTSTTGKLLAGTSGAVKLRFTYHSVSVRFGRARLISSGFDDDLAVGDFIGRVDQLVLSLEEMAGQGLLDYAQDTIAMTMFRLGEFFYKTFKLKPEMQPTLLRWMTQIYTACNQSAEERPDGVPAYIARFYRTILQSAAALIPLVPNHASSVPEGSAADLGGDNAVPIGLNHLPYHLIRGTAWEQTPITDSSAF